MQKKGVKMHVGKHTAYNHSNLNDSPLYFSNIIKYLRMNCRIKEHSTRIYIAIQVRRIIEKSLCALHIYEFDI